MHSALLTQHVLEKQSKFLVVRLSSTVAWKRVVAVRTCLEERVQHIDVALHKSKGSRFQAFSDRSARSPSRSEAFVRSAVDRGLSDLVIERKLESAGETA